MKRQIFLIKKKDFIPCGLWKDGFTEIIAYPPPKPYTFKFVILKGGKKPKPMTHNFWIYLYLHFGIDTRWQRNAWIKICQLHQSELDRENAIFMWEKSVLLDKPTSNVDA